MKHHLRFTAHAAVVIAGITSIALLVSMANMSSAEEDDTLALEVQLYAAPLQVIKNEKIRIDWDSQGADYCTASGTWSGKKEPSGSVRILAKKKTEVFTLQCFDQDGNASEKLTRKVAVVATKKQLKRKKLEAPKPLINGPAYATDGQDIVISWGSTKGTVACHASGQEHWDGLKSPTGSDAFPAAIGSEYRLSCWNENGQEGKSAVYTVKAKPKKYTAVDVGLSADYLPMYPEGVTVSALAEGNMLYVIDFVRKEERDVNSTEDDLFYWGKRIALNIYTNVRIDNRDLLKEVFAAPGQVPPDVNPQTKRIYATKNVGEHTNDDMDRFTNWGEYANNGEIPTFSPDDFGRLAVDHTLEYLQLPLDDGYQKFYTPSPVAFWFNGTVAGPPMYAGVDVYTTKDEKIRTVVMDPYSGEAIDDLSVEDMYENGIWDRTVMTVRTAEGAQQELPHPLLGDPVGMPPGQAPVIPEVQPVPETKKEESKKEEPKVSTSCQAGFLWSPTLGKCYEDTSMKKDDEAKPTCAAGSSYSITFKACFKD